MAVKVDSGVGLGEEHGPAKDVKPSWVCDGINSAEAMRRGRYGNVCALPIGLIKLDGLAVLALDASWAR